MTDSNREDDNANGNTSRSLLPEGESETRQVVSGGDLPEVDGAKPEDRPVAKAVKKQTKPPKNLKPNPTEKRLLSVIGYVANKRLSRKADATFEATIVKRMVLYRCDALDALHDLATMPITENATANHLKYLAACRLTGNVDGTATQPGDNLPETLRKLNEAYMREAPRIKEIRERVVEFEKDPKSIN